MHDCYEHLTAAAMRAEAEYCGIEGAAPPAQWRARLLRTIESGVHPFVLRDCGVSAELLAFCGITLEQLVERKRPTSMRYALEHLIEALALSFDDLCLLGFRLALLHNTLYYPLIVLYDGCALRADTLFRFELCFADVQRLVLDVDARYAPLLQLNTLWWKNALLPPPHQ